MSARLVVQVDVRRATWHPHIGISRYARSLLREIQRIDPPDLRIVPLDLTSSDSRAGEMISVGSRTDLASRLLQEQVSMWKMSGHGDLLHLPWHEGPLRPRCPMVVTVHDLAMLGRSGGHRLRLRAYYNTLLRSYIRIARRIIVPSIATLEQLEARWPGRPYVHVPSGVDEIFFSEAARPHSEAPTILYTGGFEPRKRLPDLLDALKLIAQREPDVRLIVTGVPPPDDRRAFHDHGLNRRVELVGRVSDERLAALYRSATVVAYPSELEGFGFPVLEAFASGTPVVACEAGSIPEIAQDAALLVPPRRPDELAAALLSLLQEASLRDRLSTAGRARAQAFTWRAAADETLSVYRAALADA